MKGGETLVTITLFVGVEGSDERRVRKVKSDKCRLCRRRSIPLRESPVHGPEAAARDNKGNGHAYHQEVILEAFTRLLAEPVHEEAELEVRQRDGDRHLNGYAKGGNPCEEAEKEADRSEELGGNR